MINSKLCDEQFINNIFEKYLTAKNIVNNEPICLKEATFSYGNQIIDTSENENYITTIETILALMPKNEYIFLIKTYIKPVKDNWWQKYYTKGEYQQLKTRALNYFLYLYLI